jgi:hypothetical protein
MVRPSPGRFCICIAYEDTKEKKLMLQNGMCSSSVCASLLAFSCGRWLPRPAGAIEEAEGGRRPREWRKTLRKEEGAASRHAEQPPRGWRRTLRRMLVKEEIRSLVAEGRGGAGKPPPSSLEAVVREQGHGRHRSRKQPLDLSTTSVSSTSRRERGMGAAATSCRRKVADPEARRSPLPPSHADLRQRHQVPPPPSPRRRDLLCPLLPRGEGGIRGMEEVAGEGGGAEVEATSQRWRRCPGRKGGREEGAGARGGAWPTVGE